MRYDIGIENMMFGSDYPHVEGTWPRTYDWVRATLGGIPEDEQRLILGANAARLYGFDLDELDDRAARGHPGARSRRALRQPCAGAHPGGSPRRHVRPRLKVVEIAPFGAQHAP